MSQNQINKSTLQFLKNIALNNNRDWFSTNKNTYLNAQQNMIEFVDGLILDMKKHDEIENESGKKSLYRIYKDVRFSKDKAPYNSHFSFSLRRATKLKRGGYYVNIKPGKSYLACGFFNPNPGDLKEFGQDIEANYDHWNKLLKLKTIKDNFEKIDGETVATAPKGFSIEHPAIELLRHKQFILRHHFTDKEVLSPDFAKEINRIFKSVRPYFDYMSEVLTTDLNGELIV